MRACVCERGGSTGNRQKVQEAASDRKLAAKLRHESDTAKRRFVAGKRRLTRHGVGVGAAIDQHKHGRDAFSHHERRMGGGFTL